MKRNLASERIYKQLRNTIDRDHLISETILKEALERCNIGNTIDRDHLISETFSQRLALGAGGE